MNNLSKITFNNHGEKATDSRILSSSLHSKKESKEKLRVVIIDDEALARRGLRRVLEHHSEVDIVGDCSDGSEAIEVLSKTRPDLIFLDVEMPQMNGFEVVERISPNQNPFIVFVTAHEHYALNAFKVHAIDYLVKPICEEKIDEVLQRVLQQVRHNRLKEIDSRLDSILQLIGTQNKEFHRTAPLERLTIKNHGRIYFVETDSIDWIQADGNYVTLHTGSTKHLLRIKMNQLEERLDAKIFFRIHRSTIVNVQSIKELRPYFNGAYSILLKDDEKIYSSRGYRERVEHIMNQMS
jgi:two-component system LytT family response regulator